MRYVQLRAFHYVCLHGGFSKAAVALHLTQPAVSDQVRKLEEAYDILLLSRQGKQVVPTVAGEALLEISHRFFDAEAQAVEYLAERRKVASGTLRIIVDSAIHLSDVLGVFRAKYPTIKIKIQTGNSESVITRLKDYQADIGVLGIELSSDEFVSIGLNNSPLIAFVNLTHPLARNKSITFSKLLKQSLVLREPGSRTRESLELIANERGITLSAAIEAQGREAVREIVAVGAGVGIVSRAEFLQDPRLVPLEISDCEIIMQETLICLPERAQSKNIAAFFEATRERLSMTKR
ncbi:MAG: LysR substrate-binding domain-containing protein [Granulosicoccus sp.]